MGRRAEPTLTEPRFPNNEPRLEIRGSVWRLLLAISSDTNPAPTTHEEMKLSPSIGLMASFGDCNILRVSQLMMMVSRMCKSPSPVMVDGHYSGSISTSKNKILLKIGRPLILRAG